ncbi:MBL fold metallo-hydrolase [Fulvivirga sp. RKSG066]|uniref:MBL fold metallo-hydrolase n=1 Tax=Fulvivirga aurantia TaxID=2529383 RepID=UPI0012BD80E5|nr:MBL fold metallo-hydrolase [Fulvivirga aurantia]MTI22307.1 MBL fold metallo-hydrolase [Fulvivirga aurantia]
MIIEQIYDKALAHGSYVIESEGKVALVDPGRDPQPYIDFAEKHNAEIVAVFETHPHADFASSHLEFQKRYGAKIYINPKVGVSYEYEPLEHNDTVQIGASIIKALFTPGHSPDHNSYLVYDESGNEKAVFTGDALFVGDVGRPDLREGAGNIQVSKEELAEMMYDTVNNVFKEIEENVTVYPAHGAGSLCGKNMSDDLYSSIGREKKENWAFQIAGKEEFVKSYLEGQSFIPKYFPYEVELNRKGAAELTESVDQVNISDEVPDRNKVIIDVRDQETFKKGHYAGAINIQKASDTSKFETWLGSIVGPDEQYYLVGSDESEVKSAIHRTAKIGYEINIIEGLIANGSAEKTSDQFDLDHFKQHPEEYTIVDIRNESEVADGKFFDSAINIPLPELRERASEVPTDKPVMVHCAGGYRSAAGASILAASIEKPVYDLSEAVNDFK